MLIKIEKSIPIPKSTAKKGPASRYPLPDMKVGDSFSLPISEESRVKSACQYYKRSRGMHFRTQKYRERGKERIRVWRVQ